MDLIEKLARDVTERLGSSSTKVEAKASANRALEEISEDIELLLQPDGEEDYILSHLHREKERYQADSVEELPSYVDAETLRDDPLCTCRNSDCDVKKARIPVSVQKADTLQKGIRRFKQEHAGHPEALDSAATEYRRTLSNVHQQLRLIYSALGSNVTLEALQSSTDTTSADDAEATDEVHADD